MGATPGSDHYPREVTVPQPTWPCAYQQSVNMVTRSIYVLNVQVYCEMERFNGGWNRVANIDPAGQGYCPPRMQLRSEGDVKLCVFKEDRPNIFPVNADYKYVMGYVTGFAVSDIARHSQCWVLLDTLKRVRKDTQDTPPPPTMSQPTLYM